MNINKYYSIIRRAINFQDNEINIICFNTFHIFVTLNVL